MYDILVEPSIRSTLIEAINIAVYVHQTTLGEKQSISRVGPRGEKGEQGLVGPQGPQGLPGTLAGTLDWAFVTNKPILNYIHNFNTSDNGIINIPHNMNKIPSIYAEDSSGNIWIPNQILTIDLNNTRVILTEAFSGKIICN